MTIRRDMIRAASRARHRQTVGGLGDSAKLVVNFIRKQINRDGGFRNRAGQSDLYYTVFGMEALLALQADVPQRQITGYLQKFWPAVAGLDLVHLACLARCLANLAQPSVHTGISDRIVHHLEKHRCFDGGYSNSVRAEQGTAYGCFLALGAYQDLNVEMQNSSAVAECVKSLQRPDGAYANAQTLEFGSAPATAAALTVLHYLNQPIGKSSADWLLSCFHPKGGFAVMPVSQHNSRVLARQGPTIPDLLSTATALHALALTDIPIDRIKQQCLDFLDSLWDPEGGFHGSWADEGLDCEYTYYGLLALGHLTDSDE